MPERQLLLELLIQTLRVALAPPRVVSGGRQARREARLWLLGQGPEVCYPFFSFSEVAMFLRLSSTVIGRIYSALGESGYRPGCEDRSCPVKRESNLPALDQLTKRSPVRRRRVLAAKLPSLPGQDLPVQAA